MRNILVLGAGQSAGYLVHQLLDDATRHDWFVTVGDRDLGLAEVLVGEHPRGAAIRFDVNDAEMTSSQVERSAVVVNLLPQRYQPPLAWCCLRQQRHMISVSYRDREMEEMEEEAQRNGVLFLTEVGLDPGIDLMSAAQTLHAIHAEGGSVLRFESYGSGVPSEESATNPLRYGITWNPRNVAMAGEAGAQYFEDGKIKIMPWHKIFHHPWPKRVPGIGMMEAYPNRDSLAYRDLLGLSEAQTIIRGTLRYPGWCEVWAQIVELGLPNERMVIPDLPERSWAEIVEMFLPRGVSGGGVEERVANYLRLSSTGRVMDTLRWLGLFDTSPIGVEGRTVADALIHQLKERLPLPPGGRDMVILLHDFLVRRQEGGQLEHLQSTLIARGEKNGFTAMSRTVGLPAAIATRLLLTGRLPLTGCHIPIHPAIYEPVLEELAAAGLAFEETVETVG